MTRRLKGILSGIIALFALVCATGNGISTVNPIAESVKTQSSFITEQNGVTLTEDYSPSSAGLSLDAEKSGLLISSQKTGDEAEGAGFSFAHSFVGAFSVDFRILSQKMFATGIPDFKPGTTYTETTGSDRINPYQDVKEIAFTFTDKATGKNFTVYVNGGIRYWATATKVSVKTGKMKTPVGRKYTDLTYQKAGGLDSEYCTLLHGTSFSNVGNSYSNNHPDSDGGISSQIEFDPYTMKIYAYGRTNGGIVTKLEVIDLSSAEQVGTNNVIEKNSFGEYTVSVTFTDLISDEFSYTYSNGSNSYTLSPYTRRANMILYSLNGQSLAYQNGKIQDTTPPKIILRTDKLQAGQQTKLDISTSDFLEGVGTYKGTIKYYTSYDSIRRTLLYNDGYYLTLKEAGTLTLILEGAADSVGNKGATEEYVLPIVDDVAPTVSFVQEFPDKWDITDWEHRPIVGKTDVVYSTNIPDKTVTLDFSVVAPNGREYKTGILPFTQMGEYLIRYTVRDNFGNETTLTRTLTVGDFTAPTIQVKQSIVTDVGATINLAPLSVEDYVDGATECSITVYKGEQRVGSGKRFSAETSGEYKVVYTSVDAAGNQATATTLLIVRDEEEPAKSGCASDMQGAGVLFVALTTALACVWFSKRKGENKNEENC